MIISAKRVLVTALAGAIALTGALTSARPALAQYAVAGAPGVANVSVTQGEVVIVRGDTGTQVAATLNAPLLPGDYISTAASSRAEVQFDGTSMVRLAQNTQVRFVNLNPGSREVQLASGTTDLAALQSARDSAQIDTPSVTVRANQTGDYRVSVLSNGQTEVTVRSGSATVSSAAGTQTLTPGTTLVAYGSYSNPSISLQGAIGDDAFDTFNSNRNNAIVTAYNSNQYLAPQLAGYANFSNYGQWSNVPGYGQSWAPYNQTNNWSPYSNGQWTWEPGYGYTWVGNEPWGYAPYHYGRWYNYNNQWMWQPPAYQYQTNSNTLASSWLPALVGFFLTGGSGLMGSSGYNPYNNGNIGWVPLAPGEQYNPWYPGFGQNSGYGQYGVSNVTNVYNIYRNVRYVRIVRMYPFSRFRNGEWHRPILMHPDQLRRVVIVRGAVPIVPNKTLMRTGPIGVTREIPLSSRFQATRFAAHRPVMEPMTFAKSQAAITTIVSRPPKVVALPVHPVVQAPIYNPPANHGTYHAPVMKVTEPKTAVPVQTMAPRPHPIQTMAPRPIRTMAPHPIQTMAPRPIHTLAPHPIATMAPRPIHTAPPVHVTPVHPVHTMVPAPHHPAPPPKSVAQPKPHNTNAPHPPATTTNPKPKETPPPLQR
ncbi:MAG: DUF6600 domain-containing protein [Candidatus Tumulicola sp.]